MSALYNVTTETMLSSRLKIARTPWQRVVGFLGHSCIEEDEAMWFDRCVGVHTVGMRARIDVVFLDRCLRVVAVERNVCPNRLDVSHGGASSVLELGVSRAPRFAVGDVLSFARR